LKVARLTTFVAVVLAIVCSLAVPQSGRTGTVPVPDADVGGHAIGFLSQCAQLPEAKMVRCYEAGLLAAVERGGNPATGVPAIDVKVHQAGGFLEAACHSFMHQVGREWAKRHGVTIENLYHYVPRSNDPGCSAGFGMGMAMYLGPKLILQPRSVLPVCDRLPTRFRQYTCIHGAGHAFMRGFHETLPPAIAACNSLGPMNAPDCAQGAFHDYWISLGGADGTAVPGTHVDTSPVSVCAAYQYKRPCWYRYFWERKSATHVLGASDILTLCGKLDGLQRAGCISGASLLASRQLEPVDHARMCRSLSGTDTYNCLRGVDVPALAGNRFEELSLVGTCAGLPKTTRTWCYVWFGRTLNVVENGRFRTYGCDQLSPAAAARACRAGAARIDRPLRTFS
jgi:hypothetical protein